MNISKYNLRYSAKAKYLQLRLSVKGLEVVVPTKKVFSQDFILSFIQKKQAWIEKYVETIAAPRVVLPEQIALEAIAKVWNVHYILRNSKKLQLTTQDQDIFLVGDTTDTARCMALLRHWLKNLAKEMLPTKLRQLSNDIGLSFESVRIRSNTTRWGSCSSKKNINLCANLLFLPPNLLRHVLLHELCHTKEMNHGPLFWKWLMQWDPQAKMHAKQLKVAAKRVPHWVFRVI